ncbi:hypothetical protein QWZ10_04150 [Paracoccus cavernae]|uniref:AraC family transcriptional regulator n=1 Tax=Paracoccus cavernae TaxID=1571207 RepID=A0ABT8D5W3_9RHOB|nr:hypothetical protein [Paracoccus cavernae]
MSPYHFHRQFKAVTGLTPRLGPWPIARANCVRVWRKRAAA